MITFNFHKVKERWPDNESTVVWFKKDGFGGVESIVLQVAKVRYDYQQVDKNGEWTGYNFYEPAEDRKEYLYFGNSPVDENTYWCYEEELWLEVDRGEQKKKRFVESPCDLHDDNYNSFF